MALTENDVEKLVWLALQYGGELPPMTEETVAYWEGLIGIDPDIPADVKQRLDERFQETLRRLRTDQK